MTEQQAYWHRVEQELKKRWAYPYQWGIKQDDYHDKATHFIYNTATFDEVMATIQEAFGKSKDFYKWQNYALNRWYNFHAAVAVEQCFCALPEVVPALNAKNRLVDFTIQGIPFDHKTSVFPKKYPLTAAQAYADTASLIQWLYENQSQQRRKHHHNRIFIMLYAKNGEHWKLKAELLWLKELIDNYVWNFNPERLYRFDWDTGQYALADLIWAMQ
ncbi:MAG TPA: hypothetical protein DCM08_06205 [Microscillaceae bacterium]|jgi:hypothetical protein|nr:hypothetical protein [Microscillaceae bacterium]